MELNSGKYAQLLAIICISEKYVNDKRCFLNERLKNSFCVIIRLFTVVYLYKNVQLQSNHR